MSFRLLIVVGVLLLVTPLNSAGIKSHNGYRDLRKIPNFANWTWSQRILLEGHKCNYQHYARKYKIQDWWTDYFHGTAFALSYFKYLLEAHQKGDVATTIYLESLCFFPDQRLLYECSPEGRCRCMSDPIRTTATHDGHSIKCLVKQRQRCIPKRNLTAIYQCEAETYCNFQNSKCRRVRPADQIRFIGPLDEYTDYEEPRNDIYHVKNHTHSEKVERRASVRLQYSELTPQEYENHVRRSRELENDAGHQYLKNGTTSSDRIENRSLSGLEESERTSEELRNQHSPNRSEDEDEDDLEFEDYEGRPVSQEL